MGSLAFSRELEVGVSLFGIGVAKGIEPAPSIQKQILILDDPPTNLDVTSGGLTDTYKTKVATNGQKALALALVSADLKPDLTLLDVVMPEMDGYEVCT